MIANTVRPLSTKIAIEAQHGLISQVIKDVIFSLRPRGAAQGTAAISDLADNAMKVDS